MILSILLIMLCTLLITSVLIQNSKGVLQSETVKKVVGVSKSGVFIERTTWTLALLVMVFAMVIG